MKSTYIFTALLSLVGLSAIAQQKCEQLSGYDLCKLSDLKHILTVKPIIFTDGFTDGVDSAKLAEWNKIVSSIGAYIAKNHPELNKEFNQLQAISDSMVNTVKITKNATNRADKEKVVKSYFQNFKKSPEDTFATLRKDLAPGTFSRHKETRELLVDFVDALKAATNLLKSDAQSMGLIK
jgi:ABC-type transporter Mla maintaining outer membrane lipid asymmetry ATPase subunit MlaF